MTVCAPSSIGFNMADLEVMTRLPEVCVPLLKALAASPYRADLENAMRDKITAQWYEITTTIATTSKKWIPSCVNSPLCVFLNSVEELCAVDLYDSGTRDSHAKLELLLSASKQLYQSGILSSVLHYQVIFNLIPNWFTMCYLYFHFIFSISFVQDVAYSSSLGSRLLMAVYKGIAPGENRKSLPSMDVSNRKLANGLVQLAFSLSDQVSTTCMFLCYCRRISFFFFTHESLADHLQSLNDPAYSFIKQTEQLVRLLLNSITLSVPLSGSLNPHFLSFSHGEYFYSLFQNTINAELLLKLDLSVPLLLNAATESPGMVRLLQ